MQEYIKLLSFSTSDTQKFFIFIISIVNMNNNNRFPVVATVLLLAILGTTLRNSQQVERNEALQVGGKENWNKLKKIMKSDNYKTTNTQQVDMIIQEFENPMLNEANTMERDGAINDENEIDLEDLLNSLNSEEDETNTTTDFETPQSPEEANTSDVQDLDAE